MTQIELIELLIEKADNKLADLEYKIEKQRERVRALKSTREHLIEEAAAMK